MGSFVSAAGPLRKYTWKNFVKQPTNSFACGRSFVEMTQEHHQYGLLINVKTTYEVKLVHRESAHWYFLVKTKDSTLPYISLEIRTTDLSDLVSFTCEVDSLNADTSSDIGEYQGSLLSLCELADRVVRDMGSYDLLTSNCQTFCNEVLKRMGKPEFPTSTELLDREFDLLGEALFGHLSTGAESGTAVDAPEASPSIPIPISNRSASVSESPSGAIAIESLTRELDIAFPGGVPSPSIDDLPSLKTILVPIRHNWKEIGNKLFINPQTLETIGKRHSQRAERCLNEMLRAYLQRTNPPPLWKDLVIVVMEYNVHVARSIVKRAKRIQSTAV
jgi:hypothetical protein